MGPSRSSEDGTETGASGGPTRSPCPLLTQTAIDAIPGAVVCFDRAHTIAVANHRAEQLFGYGRAELLGQPLALIIPSGATGLDHPAVVVGESSPAKDAPEPAVPQEPQRLVGLHKSGRSLPLEVRWGTSGLGDGRLFACTAHEAGQRPRAIQRAGASPQASELKEVNAELAVLYEISSTLIRSMDLKPLLANVLDTITDLEVLNVEKKGGIFLVEGDWMHLVAHLGHGGCFVDMHKGMRVGECLCGRVAVSGEVYVAPNCHDSPEHTIVIPGSEPHGHVVLPLKANGQVVGVIYLYLPEDATLDGVALKTLETMGNQIGMAIDNARLFETTKALSLQDPLTGLANRRLMELFLERNLARSRRSEGPFSLLMLDIDHFKGFNDKRGHAAGDALLKAVAQVVTSTIREADLATRYGGDELLVLLPETPLQEAIEAAERILQQVREQTDATVSLGVACFHARIATRQDLLAEADDAMYRAKRAGRNRIGISPTSQQYAQAFKR